MNDMRKKPVADPSATPAPECGTGKSKLHAFHISAGTSGHAMATITLEINGRHRTAQASSSKGPLDATARAIEKIVPHDAILVQYGVTSKGRGTNVEATVTIALQDGARTEKATAVHCDTNLATAWAYLDALNSLRCAQSG